MTRSSPRLRPPVVVVGSPRQQWPLPVVPDAAEIGDATLDATRGLVIALPARGYATLVRRAQRHEPPLQVLVLSDQPRTTRAELARLGLFPEVLRIPPPWSEVLRRFGLDEPR